MGPREFDLRRVLSDDDHGVGAQAFEGGIVMRLEHLGRIGLVVVEEAIRRLRFGPTSASRWNAERGFVAEAFEQQLIAAIQTLIAEIRSFGFDRDPSLHGSIL